jgi:hypothetical protein
LEDPGVDERIILKWIFVEVGWGIDWIDLAQGRTGGGALASGMMNFQIP